MRKFLKKYVKNAHEQWFLSFNRPKMYNTDADIPKQQIEQVDDNTHAEYAKLAYNIITGFKQLYCEIIHNMIF